MKQQQRTGGNGASACRLALPTAVAALACKHLSICISNALHKSLELRVVIRGVRQQQASSCLPTRGGRCLRCSPLHQRNLQRAEVRGHADNCNVRAANWARRGRCGRERRGRCLPHASGAVPTDAPPWPLRVVASLLTEILCNAMGCSRSPGCERLQTLAWNAIKVLVVNGRKPFQVTLALFATLAASWEVTIRVSFPLNHI